MRDCTNCKWDMLSTEGGRIIQCGQGHARTFQKLIHDCHAWGEKLNCWCQQDGERRVQLHDFIKDKWNLTHYQMRSPEVPKYCPVCGKKLEERRD